MLKSQLNAIFFGTLLSLATLLRLDGQTGRARIENQLSEKYALTSVDGNGVVTQAGTVLILRQGHVRANPAVHDYFWPNYYKGDGVKQPATCSGGCLGFRNEVRFLEANEKVFVAAIEVPNDKDIIFKIQSCKACPVAGPDPNHSPFRATLKFQFGKGALTTATFEQIQDTIGQVFAIDASARRSTIQVTRVEGGPRLPAVYSNLQAPSDRLRLNTDHTYSLLVEGQNYQGTFTVNGNTLELKISPDTTSTASIAGNDLTDANGQVWTLQKPANISTVGVLQNQDVMALINAGLPEANIIAKIGASKCQFDTSADAILALSRAGASPEVLKAMRTAQK